MRTVRFSIPPARGRVLAAVVGLLVGMPSISTSATLRVPRDHASILDALDLAATGDTVLVACGTYTESKLRVRGGVTLLGEDPDSTCTILQGDGSPYAVVTGSGGIGDARVKRITLRGGTSAPRALVDARSNRLVLSGCVIEGLTAGDSGGTTGYYLRLEGCRIADNHLGSGNGLVLHAEILELADCIVEHNSCTQSAIVLSPNLDIERCVFRGNVGANLGTVFARDDARVFQCDFLDNTAPMGGALTFRDLADAEVRACRFEQNSAGIHGGAVWADSLARFHDCVFRGNTAAQFGGAVAAAGPIVMRGCRFEGNHAGLDGGGLWARSPSPVEECVFLANTGGRRGGAYASDGRSAPVVRSTFRDNGAPSGGALSLSPGPLDLQASVIQASTGGGAVAFEGPAPAAYVACSNLFANAGGDWTGPLAPYYGVNGNFSADALFCLPSGGAGEVSDGSPLLDANNECGVRIGAGPPGCAPAGVVVASRPPGLGLVIDGETHVAPVVLAWTPGSWHTVAAPAQVEELAGARNTFVAWSDGGAREHPVAAPPEGSVLVADFTKTYHLETRASDHGTVTPPSGWFPARELVTLAGHGDPLYLPAGWTGTGIGSYTGPGATTDLLLVAPVTQEVHFLYVGPYPLTMVAEGGGSVEPQSGPYPANLEVDIRAVWPEGFRFDGWTGTGPGSYTGPDSVATIVMDGPITQLARFHYAGFATLEMRAIGDGELVPASGVYPQEEPITIDAFAGPGFVFHRWVGEGPGSYTGTDRTGLVVPRGPVTQTAYFAHEGNFPLTVTGGSNGAVGPPSGDYPAGSVHILSALPRTGFVFREWRGEGQGSYSGPDANAAITLHGPITQEGIFVPDGSPNGYELSISASDTDPFANTALPAGGPRTLYLWLTCSELGTTAFEAGVESSILLADFEPAPGVIDFGYGTDLLLAVEGCPTGHEVARILGSWIGLDTGGTLRLGPSRTNELFAAVDCGALPSIWPDPYVRGFSSDGPAPITGDNACEGTVSVVLSQLAAVPGRRSVLVTWVTSAERDHAGFHVYRADAFDGPYARLTGDLFVSSDPHRFEDGTAKADRVYYYKVAAVDVNGSEQLFGPATVTTPRWPPLVTALTGAFPNPFRGETELRFSLAGPGPARLTVYDLAGRLVHVVRDGHLPAGEHSLTWNGRTGAGTAASGIYFVRFEAGDRRDTHRIVYLGASR